MASFCGYGSMACISVKYTSSWGHGTIRKNMEGLNYHVYSTLYNYGFVFQVSKFQPF